jgi:hypothetical protein
MGRIDYEAIIHVFIISFFDAMSRGLASGILQPSLAVSWDLIAAMISAMSSLVKTDRSVGCQTIQSSSCSGDWLALVIDI